MSQEKIDYGSKLYWNRRYSNLEQKYGIEQRNRGRGTGTGSLGEGDGGEEEGDVMRMRLTPFDNYKRGA